MSGMGFGGLEGAFVAEEELERLLLEIQEELSRVAGVHMNRCPSLRLVAAILSKAGYRLEVRAVKIENKREAAEMARGNGE